MAINTSIQEFGVFDIVGKNRKYSSFQAIGNMDVDEILSVSLPSILIFPHSLGSSNKCPYLMDKTSLVLDDIVSFSNTPRLDLSCVASIDKMILSLDYNLISSTFKYSVSSKKNKYQEKDLKLNYWFSAVRRKVAHHISNNNHIIPRVNVIPIPDRLTYDAQEAVLKAFGKQGKNVLLWRSVAACIGYEEVLKEKGLKDNSIVAVVDCNTTGVIVSKLTMHEIDGRLIPGHRIFYDCDTGFRKVENYPFETNYREYDSTAGEIPFDIDSKGQMVKRKISEAEILEKIQLSDKPDYIIVLGEACGVDWASFRTTRILLDYDGSSVVKGAGRFANRMTHKILSYYDECDELSMVIFTKNEEVLFKTLIKGTDKLAIGINIPPTRVDGVKLQKGSNEVRFLLRLGYPGKDKPLKDLIQKFTLDEELKNNPREIELALYPSLIAGQGRAKVRVTVANPKDNSIFKAVDLNWEEMKDAVSKKKVNGRIVPETLRTLEETLDRSIPVSVPPVQCNYSKFTSIKYFIWEYVYGNISEYEFRQVVINQPSFPNKDSKGIDRFQKTNCFGSPKANVQPNFSETDKKYIEDFCKKLNSDALSNWNNAEYILTKIGWTYHGEYFPHVLEKIMCEIEEAAYSSGSIATQKFTICGNLITDNKQFVRFMKAFMTRVNRNLDSLNNWLRGASMILFSNDDFLEDSSLTLRDYYNLMNNLVRYYKYNIGHDILTNNALTVMIFLLKVRKFHPEFCRPETDYDNFYGTYQALYEISEVPSRYINIDSQDIKLQKMLRGFLIGKGSTDLPSV